jgi:hypothetical protein
VRQGADWTAGCHPAAIGSRRWPDPHPGRVVVCCAVLVAARPRRSPPTASQRGSLQWLAIPGCLPCPLSPVDVHHGLSTHPVRRPGDRVIQPSGAQLSNVRPSGCIVASSPSGVRSSGVRRPGSGGPALWGPPSAVRPSGMQLSGVRPSAVQPSGVHPSFRSVRLLPHQPDGGVGDQVGAARQPSRREWVESSLVGHVCRRLGRRLEQAWTEARVPRSHVGHRGTVADPAGSCSAGCTQPRTQEVSPCGSPVGGSWARIGKLVQARGVLHLPRSRRLGWMRDYCRWSSWSLPAECRAPKGRRAYRRGWRAAPARPRYAASAPGSAPAAL